MASRRFTLALLSFAGAASLSASTLADGVLFPGTRPLGTGGALRALATGDSGPQLNPSGISLIRTYQVEGAYQYGKTAASQDARFSAIDSTSGLNLGGALNYTYHRASLNGQSETGHIIGGSLSFPFADKIFVGGTTKWVHADDITNHSGFTYDAGLTVRPMSQLSFGVAGYNLRKFDVAWLPRGVGGGVAVLAMPTLLLVFDSVYENASTSASSDGTIPATSSTAVHYMGGAELSFS